MMAKALKFFSKNRNSILWGLVILILCTMPPSGFPKVSVSGIDKLVHFGLFAVLTLLVISENNTLRLSGSVLQKTRWVGIVVSIIYGGLVELLQLKVFIYRGADWFDLIADVVGTLIAAWLYLPISRLTRRLV
ncbi:MAG TPA: VanZ family protein [Tenuifilaceae bacterium]|nr:VanZ family protein [Tenuifilaceae bacterium]